MSVSFYNGYVVSGRVFLVDCMLEISCPRFTIAALTDFSKLVPTFSWLNPGNELKKPRLMAASQVNLNGMKNVTCRKLINYAIVICWYAELKNVFIVTVVVSTTSSSNNAIL